MSAYLEKKSEKERTLIPIFQDHNKRVKSLIDVEYSAGTYERYVVSLKHTHDFIQHQCAVQDIALHKINHTFIADYDFYLFVCFLF